mgnify:CR=1 FL=1
MSRTFRSLSFVASNTPEAQASREALIRLYGNTEPTSADVIVALGGDGFMLQTLHDTERLGLPVYGMNCGTVGFLMNAYQPGDLPERLAMAEEAVIHPLRMTAIGVDGVETRALAINEVSLLRAGPQAAKLAIYVDGKLRLEELVCDGALLCTPAGSTAYNYSAHGPILPIGSDVLALTAVAAFRPRRWRGALLPKTAETENLLDAAFVDEGGYAQPERLYLVAQQAVNRLLDRLLHLTRTDDAQRALRPKHQ